ncbi:MAG: DUF2225 domain-containing protein [Clostridiales bacterium]|nr:DUF2225 domain-containing protein [Clostridiales bacterium]
MINIGTIRNISRVKKCPRGLVITGEGLTNIMLIILKGDVGVYTDYRLPNAEMIRVLGPGDVFADPGLLQDKRASYATVALSETIVIPIERTSFNKFVLEEPSLAFEIIKELSLRLEQTSEPLMRSAGETRHTDNKPDETKPEKQKKDEGKQKTVKTADEPASAPPDKTASQPGKFMLFPEEHGNYTLLLNNNDTERLMKKSHTCPICNGNFEALTVKSSKLVLASTDADMRNRYKGIEPLYYETLTCPHCLFSALPDFFGNPDKSKQNILRELDKIKNSVVVRQDAERDTNSVFAGFYLALYCAQFSFSRYQLVAGKLLYKLSRIYQDAGDENMEIQTARRALENYLNAYEKIGIPEVQEQQVCILIGELYLKLGDLKNAVSFFFKAKTSRISTPVLKNHADNRIYDIREMAAANR